jgi:hypothetical protein
VCSLGNIWNDQIFAIESGRANNYKKDFMILRKVPVMNATEIRFDQPSSEMTVIML